MNAILNSKSSLNLDFHHLNMSRCDRGVMVSCLLIFEKSRGPSTGLAFTVQHCDSGGGTKCFWIPSQAYSADPLCFGLWCLLIRASLSVNECVKITYFYCLTEKAKKEDKIFEKFAPLFGLRNLTKLSRNGSSSQRWGMCRWKWSLILIHEDIAQGYECPNPREKLQLSTDPCHTHCSFCNVFLRGQNLYVVQS